MFVNRDNLRRAIVRLVNATLEVRDQTLWGQGTACASDSKKFGAWQANLLTEWHARYRGAGVMIYWHVERRSVAIYSQLKSCSASEVAAMIQGVLHHLTSAEIDRSYVDTHGASVVGFAFAHLLGFDLLPRLKNIGAVRLYRPDDQPGYAQLGPVLTRPVRWELIAQHYDQLVRYGLGIIAPDATSVVCAGDGVPDVVREDACDSWSRGELTETVPSIEQLQREIARLKKDEADLRRKLSDAQGAAAKDAAAAQRKRESALRASSLTSAQSSLREAERLEKRAADHTKKAADIASKLADNGKRQGDKVSALASAEREAQRRRDREDDRRRQTEKRHAQEVARLSRPTVRYVHEVRVIEPPKPERLRVLYLAANPEMDLRVDAEVRQVREAVRKALHRDLVDIDHRPAATPEDLLDGINELRPHVIHFAGHGGGAAVLFDNGQVDNPQGRTMPFGLLGRALVATDTPPTLLVLNACDTVDGADALLNAVPVVIAMSSSIGDLAAAVFAARFYAAIASAQSVASALDQATVGVDMAGLGEGWVPDAVVRAGVDLGGLVLVQPPPLLEAI